MRKGIKFGIIGAIAVIIGVTVFYLASPLFISTEIDEPLPEGAEIPPQSSNQFQEFMAMSEEERIEAGNQMNEQEKNQIMLEFAGMNTSIDESMSQGSETNDSLLTGSFIGVGDGIHDAQGIVKVIPVESGGNVLRLEDLVVTNGPDLYVYLSTDKSASDFVNLGRLKANIGSQNYPIPAGTDMTKYDTVLIWCKAFSVLFGSADLTSH
ncbi:MAG TPA: DM13 domain-containing protein [Nitrososphaeraceae archaeon]|nr:DM13 domain-containing protein [Nitrososphaeraceae archaeon]